VTYEASITIDRAMEDEARNLRRGWTTGACAAAAAKAACAALRGGTFPDPVEINLPGGQRPGFALAVTETGEGFARAGIVKDAGDDPDVTHGALIVATVRRGEAGSGVTFSAGEGVGMVTRPGLPIPVGEPAINPVPRTMIAQAIADVAGEGADYHVEISVPGGQAMAAKTLNGRLGIVGGISILGTTGIVIPFSCSSWIHSIHRGIDVARAMGLDHVAGSTGSASEAAVQKHHGLSEVALIDMGDFAGGMLKYLRAHPVAKVTVAGGVAKMTKLAQGMLDLHSKRGTADLDALADVAVGAGADAVLSEKIRSSNTVAEAFGHAEHAGIALGDAVAEAAWQTAAAALAPADIALEILIFDRDGNKHGEAAFRPVHDASRPRKRR
jgi:cobalt-precorrin-5B (C1)-methyltransferase